MRMSRVFYAKKLVTDKSRRSY